MGVAIKVEVKGLEEFKKALSGAPEVARREVGTAIEKSILTIQRNVVKEAPVNKQTGGGNLRQNIRGRMTSKLRGMVESTAPYSSYVHTGTRPHAIRPRTKKVLANTRTGQFFGTLVRHPGTSPNPFFLRGIQRSAGDINVFFQRALDRIIKSLK